ncbi:DNA adenine methylase [Dyadobacter flavalbus]|uniref:DNA adenine methylase n=1 Tax=Dyadobacter flavalbus TaxID=2579942 RepID=A0A5M8QXU6_9BACT|nr:DNA adenine methylase [Dyadobacter flavalbus]KAA6438832.1 DNA adenine methylase [Dyadobacter flavalbus]
MITDIKRPVLRYHGGKFLLAPWIISHFPKHRIYVEPFGGGASVLMRKQRSYAEVYNDKWDTVVNVFQVLRDPDLSANLKRQLELTPFSRSEFMKTGEIDIQSVSDPIEKARLTIFRSFAGFGSASTNAKYATGFRANSHRSGTTPAQDWVNYPANIESFVDRLRGVCIENRDFKEISLQHDSTETLHFWDPPYVHETRNMARGNAAYECEMTDQDHIDMIEFANTLTGMVIICGYDCDLYQVHLQGWLKVSRKAFADGAAERVECLWLNPAARARQNQLTIFN